MADVSDEVLKAILNKLDNLEDNVNGMKLDMNKRFDKVNDKFDGTDARFDGIDARFDGIDAGFDDIDARIDGIDARFDGIDARFDDIDAKFDDIDARFDDIDARFEVVDANILEVKTLATRTALELENSVIPKLQIVAEQHGSIIDKLDTMNIKLDKTMNTVDMHEMRLNIYSSDLKDIKNKLETA